MFKQLEKLQKDSQGFTLVEIMIVVAIIGILAAIAIPQFAAYRTRSYNATAEALNRNAVNSQADINAELGAYGWTEAPADASDLATGPAANPGEATTANGVTTQVTAATANAVGGRLAGNNGGAGNKEFAVPLAFGTGMAILANVTTPVANMTANDNYVIFTRAAKGDTAYGSDSDATAGILYSVSNPAWTVGNALNANTLLVAVVFGNNGFASAPNGGGAPTQNWQQAK